MSDDQLGTPIGKQVEEIWKAVLAVPGGLEGATFFELNGDSIAAVRLVSRIETELGIEVDVGDIFEEDPTLDAFVRGLVAKARGSAGPEGDSTWV